MRKSNAEFTEEVFLRSSERKKRQKKYKVAISTGVTAAVLVLCLYMNRDIILSSVESEGEAGAENEAESGFEEATLSVAINRGAGTDNTYMNTAEAERLVRLLDMYTMEVSIESEGVASSESVTESEYAELEGESSTERAVYQIMVTDVDGASEEYFLYSDGVLKCEDGSVHALTDEELDSLVELIE